MCHLQIDKYISTVNHADAQFNYILQRYYHEYRLWELILFG